MNKTVTKENLEEISRLFVRVFNNPPWNDQWNFETAYKRLDDLLRTPGFYGTVKYLEGQPAAVILGRSEQYYNGEFFQIQEFFVDPVRQRGGIGRELLAELTDELGTRKISNIYLITAHGHATEGFYQKNGFKTESDMILMSKLLENK